MLALANPEFTTKMEKIILTNGSPHNDIPHSKRIKKGITIILACLALVFLLLIPHFNHPGWSIRSFMAAARFRFNSLYDNQEATEIVQDDLFGSKFTADEKGYLLSEIILSPWPVRDEIMESVSDRPLVWKKYLQILTKTNMWFLDDEKLRYYEGII